MSGVTTPQAIEQCAQRNSEANKLFVGLIWQVDRETKDAIFCSPSNVENLCQLGLSTAISEVADDYSDLFPSELPKGIPSVRMGHQFKIDLEDVTPPIHRPLYKFSPLEIARAKKQIQDMFEHEFIQPSDSPYGGPHAVSTQERWQPLVSH